MRTVRITRPSGHAGGDAARTRDLPADDRSARDEATARWLATADDEAVRADAPARLAERVTGSTRPVEIEVDPTSTAIDEAAAAAGFVLRRELHELRRSLPLPSDLPRRPLPLRAFRPGVDDPAFLAVNNRAFDWHPEQGGWSATELRERLEEPWFDPEGFLVHCDDDGEIAGFCWTKVHDDEDPPSGEIFVIGVDPDHHGKGLGRDLVVAGLDHLAGRGLRRAVLWTEAGNVPAVALYRSLGFAPTRRHCWYRWQPAR